MAFQQIFSNGEDGIDVRTIISFWANPSVIDRDLTAPPGGESNGDAYIVGTSATGDWAGQDGNIALYLSNETGYTFFTPVEGNHVYIDDEDQYVKYTGSAWTTNIDTDGQFTVNGSLGDFVVQDNGATVLMTRASSNFIRASDASGSLVFQAGGSNNVLTINNALETKCEGTVYCNNAASGATADADGNDLIVENSGDAGMSILGGTTSNCTINFGDSGDANIGYITYDNNDDSLAIGVNAGEKAKFLSGGGVTFNADTSTSNALDDYEEGTHTATITCGGSGTITLNTAGDTLAYTKVGNKVTVTGVLLVNSVSSPVGYFAISLPFTSDSLTDEAAYSAGSLFITGVNAANAADFYGRVNENSAEMRVYLGDSTSAQSDSANEIIASASIAISVTYFSGT